MNPVAEPKYPSGEEVHAGDKISFGDRRGLVMFVTKRNEYAPRFPRGEWNFVDGNTIAVQFDDGSVMMYDGFCVEDRVSLLSRLGAA